MKRIRKWFWIALAVVAGFYLIDEIVARVRTRGAVDVSVYYVVTRKDGRTDYSRGDPQTEPCVNSLLSHMGQQSCWSLVRNPRKDIEVGIQRNDFWKR